MAPADPTRQARPPRQERSHATVRRILDATLALLARDGIEAVTTNRIAAEAGVSVASLYRFFPAKQAVIYAAYGEWIEELAGQIAILVDAWQPLLVAEPARWAEAAAALADVLGESRRGARVEYELLRAMFSHRALRARDEAHTRALGTAVAGLMRAAGARLADPELAELAAFANEQFTLATELGAGRTEAEQARLVAHARRAHVALWRAAVAAEGLHDA